MKRYLLLSWLLLITSTLIAFPRADTLNYKPFGKVVVLRSVSNPNGVVLMISDKDGWNGEMDVLANRVIEQQLMVVCINLHNLITMFSESKSQCLYPASDFENLSIYIQKKFGLKTYFKPIVVGRAEGGTLAYALIVQSPANTFKGGVALGFSSTIDLSKKFCVGSGLHSSIDVKNHRVSVMTSNKLLAPFVVIPFGHNMAGQAVACKKFFRSMANAEVCIPEKSGVELGWTQSMASAIQRIQSTKAFGGSVNATLPNVVASEIADIPFVETDVSSGKSSMMALLISGDGGWTDFDQSLADKLAERGVPSVGLDTQKYFWEKKTPEETALDMEKLLLFYSKKFGRDKILLMGYSFGADVIPFVANRLSTNVKSRVVMVAMLSPDDKTDFEVTISSMLSLDMESGYDVAPEVRKINFVPKLCFYGSDEDEKQDQELFRNQGAQIIIINGGHHYGNHYGAIISSIFAPLKKH